MREKTLRVCVRVPSRSVVVLFIFQSLMRHAERRRDDLSLQAARKFSSRNGASSSFFGQPRRCVGTPCAYIAHLCQLRRIIRTYNNNNAACSTVPSYIQHYNYRKVMRALNFIARIT